MKSYVMLLVLLISLLTIFTACNATINYVASKSIDYNGIDKDDSQEQDMDDIVYAHPEPDDIKSSVDNQDDTNHNVIIPPSCTGEEDFFESDVVTIRFYYHSLDIDPNVYSLPESFLYNSEEIYINNFRDELIRLMHEYTGIRMLDVWFEGSKLYVDLHEDALLFFNQGTAGSAIRINILERTLASVPDITSFEVFVNGQNYVEREHFNFGFVIIVENGEIVERECLEIHTSNGLYTWQEAYAKLLRKYAALPLNTINSMEAGWHFALHDIDQDGTPELFLAMLFYTGHTRYRYIYTFADGRYLSIEFETMLAVERVFVLINDEPFIVFYDSFASGGGYDRKRIDEGQLVTDYRGFYHASQAGLDMTGKGYNIWEDGYYWFDLFITPYLETPFDRHLYPVTIEEFENVFGSMENRKWIKLHPITEENILTLFYNHK